MSAGKMAIAAVAAILLAAESGAAVNIETVHVGNAGNAPDTRYETPGFGGVGYAYNIGRYEVTAGQYTEFLNAVAGVDTYNLYYWGGMWSNALGCQIERYSGSGTLADPWRYRVAADWANRPVNFVGWDDAARFANWLHNGQPSGAQDLTTTEDGAYFLNGATTDEHLVVTRKADWKWAISTEDEWYKAAYYDPGTGSYYDYPTSSDTAPGYVNDSGDLSGTGGLFVEGGTDPGNYATHNGDGGTAGIGDPYYRTVVGEWENSGSPYGTFDQGGNVWEWNEAVLPWWHRGLRGGSLWYSPGVVDLHASSSIGFLPTTHSGGIGFRVCQVPEPCSLAVLALGGIGVLLGRRGVRA